jgi:hypothetical protein
MKWKNSIKEPYYMHGKQLKVVQETKYLGITIKDDLIWNLHINNIVSSANQVQGMLSRNIKKAPQQIKITAINTLVRPRVDVEAFTVMSGSWFQAITVLGKNEYL